MNNLLKQLQQKNLVWQATESPTKTDKTPENSGFIELDKRLNGGFPKGVNELQSDIGIGELRLLLPTLKQAIAEQRLIVFISPRALICSEALVGYGIELDKVLLVLAQNQQDALWAAEQCLRSGICHSVVMWPQHALEIHQIKRLQIACQTGNSSLFLLRETKAEQIALPLDLSLSLFEHPLGVFACINKRKRGWPSERFTIDMTANWPALTLAKNPNNVIEFPQIRVG